MIRGSTSASLALCAALVAPGCAELRDELRAGHAVPRSADTTPRESRDPSRIAFDLRYRIALAGSVEGSYVPLERASAALDSTHGRLYAGTSHGTFFAYRSDGTRLYRRSFGDAIDGGIAVDSVRDIVYVGTSSGKVHALHGASGEPMWTAETGQPIVGSAAMTDDTLYVVADSDVVSALDREDGTVLWTYRRPQAEEITITGHAGLLLHGDTLVGAFNDGVVAGIRASDGAVLWEIDTSSDLQPTTSGLPRMRDVDTTPVQIGDRLYVASFAGGLYELDANNGTVLHRDESWTGITALVGLPSGDLFLASADRGFARIDPRSHVARWTRPLDRGAPVGAKYLEESDAIVFGESHGSLLALDASTGSEVARFETGYGFGSAPVDDRGVVAILSNTATLFVVVAR